MDVDKGRQIGKLRRFRLLSDDDSSHRHPDEIVALLGTEYSLSDIQKKYDQASDNELFERVSTIHGSESAIAIQLLKSLREQTLSVTIRKPCGILGEARLLVTPSSGITIAFDSLESATECEALIGRICKLLRCRWIRLDLSEREGDA